MHIKLSRELSVPFSEGYDTSLTDVSENDFKDTPQVKWRKKRGRDKRWERGRAVLWRRCNLARLSVTLPNLGFAQVTYPGDLMVPEHNEGSMGISVLPLLFFLPNPPIKRLKQCLKEVPTNF